CEECKSFYVDECETHGPPSFIPDSPAPLGAPQRALLTLPPGMMVSRSSIPEAGLGVFNQGETVPVGTHFGPYEGEVTTREEAIESSYSWVLCRKKNQFEYIDAKRDTHSNWMRYVNCARSEEEQNLVAFQHRGRVFYRCLRPILPGQELLLWHEDDYAKELGITWDYLWDKKCNPAGRSTRAFPCTQCRFSFTAELYLNKHIKRSHSPIRHERKHTGFRPCHCSECGRSFSRPQSLKAHQLLHKGERPYHCSQCDKSFSRNGHLRRHHQKMHSDRMSSEIPPWIPDLLSDGEKKEFVRYYRDSISASSLWDASDSSIARRWAVSFFKNSISLSTTGSIMGIALFHHLPLPTLLLQGLLDKLGHLTLLTRLLTANHEPANT
ncbi:histone-lysine N-methyltransferase PRDM9-like, partial [Scleropages formosus]